MINNTNKQSSWSSSNSIKILFILNVSFWECGKVDCVLHSESEGSLFEFY